MVNQNPITRFFLTSNSATTILSLKVSQLSSLCHPDLDFVKNSMVNLLLETKTTLKLFLAYVAVHVHTKRLKSSNNTKLFRDNINSFFAELNSLQDELDEFEEEYLCLTNAKLQVKKLLNRFVEIVDGFKVAYEMALIELQIKV